MTDFDALISRLDASDEDTFWFGPAAEGAISELESLLGQQLPPTFREFLKRCGGGGVEESEVSGVYGEASKGDRGTVWGDTKRCRQDFGLPDHLVVVFFSGDEVCWCLDCSQTRDDGECPVVSYSVFDRKVDREIAEDFGTFFEDYVELRTQVFNETI